MYPSDFACQSFAAAQVYAKHPEALSHFFRNERDGRTAARQLLRQHSGVMTEEMVRFPAMLFFL